MTEFRLEALPGLVCAGWLSLDDGVQVSKTFKPDSYIHSALCPHVVHLKDSDRTITVRELLEHVHRRRVCPCMGSHFNVDGVPAHGWRDVYPTLWASWVQKRLHEQRLPAERTRITTPVARDIIQMRHLLLDFETGDSAETRTFAHRCLASLTQEIDRMRATPDYEAEFYDAIARSMHGVYEDLLDTRSVHPVTSLLADHDWRVSYDELDACSYRDMASLGRRVDQPFAWFMVEDGDSASSSDPSLLGWAATVVPYPENKTGKPTALVKMPASLAFLPTSSYVEFLCFDAGYATDVVSDSVVLNKEQSTSRPFSDVVEALAASSM